MDDDNALVKADKIYFEGTAVASDGHRYTVNEKSDKTLMKRENQYKNIQYHILAGRVLQCT